MSDTDRRDRRRVSDDTRARIDKLADGWSVPAARTAQPTPASVPARPRAAAAVDDVLDELMDAELSDEELAETIPRPVARRPPAAPAAQPQDDELAAPVARRPPAAPAAQPQDDELVDTVEEPDSGRQRAPAPLEIASSRPAEAAREVDATELMVGAPDMGAPAPNQRVTDRSLLQTLPGIGSDASDASDASDVSDSRDRSDATEYQPPKQRETELVPQVRTSLPRRQGILGDVRYVFTVLAGVAAARHELGQVRERLAEERDLRLAKVVTMAREAVGDAKLGLPSLASAREQLMAIEERRSKNAGGVTAAEEEQGVLERTRKAESEAHAAELARLEAQIEELDGALVPRDRRAAELRKQSDTLRSTLTALDERLRRLSKGLGKADEAARAGIEAELASVRAEREQVARDEPPLAAELSELEPEIARLDQQRSEAKQAIEAVRQRERDSKARADARHAELATRKQAGERAVRSAEQDRHTALRELGEALCLERPAPLSLRLRAVESHDIAIATLERRAIELEELIRGINKLALARGIAVLLAATAGPALIIWLLA